MEICCNALISILYDLSQLFFDIQHQAEDKASPQRRIACVRLKYPPVFLLFLCWFGVVLFLGFFFFTF